MSSLLLRAVVLLCVPLMMSACTYRAGGKENIDTVLYDLRKENTEQKERITALEEERTNRLAQIDSLEKQLAGNVSKAEGVSPGDLPRVVRINFDRLSRLMDADKDGRADGAVVYLQTLDQKGRTTSAAGRVTLTARVMNEQGEATELANQVFDAATFDAAARSGLTGTHHTLRMTFEPTDAKSVTIHASFTDAATGVTMEHEQALELP